jgi:hypothetical protein
MDEASGTAEAVKTETAVQLVKLLALLASVGLVIWVERLTADPDVMRRARMAWHKSMEKSSARSAAKFWARAEKARLAYESEAD